mmetsp:Transcript_21985/g.46374  ORF Transcript_21985/g.46374 Transcript_21985/m.46374 type:complete len:239 (-) Transcript_21985:255-971(-)|eukprot:CAMPEP_0201125116 /NCGR_PEP_ID=MMETSP0850-20130426/19270_1 /ASSEMBLY_ACC=CAM_ASM_000622 /TAXON_ID=183588 /ORGANISM="Pseudo-nitzschia fraudulenta, Strain WWA7" /LENGTH=238 /DNA_ID=CAMNT_0047392935 /DNA_START=92 /DNA_END=808 /DNA_ORIENTATION=+
MTPSSNDSAEARKRRKEIIQSQRSENELVANTVAGLATNGSTRVSAMTNSADAKNPIIGESQDDASSTTVTIDANGNEPDKKPPKKRKVAPGDASLRKINKNNPNINADVNSKTKKTQIRYDPDVPMSKDQLAAWRREARRVRNRESAAASRQRIRNRISELEDEVGEWKAKYSQAIQRLECLEKYMNNNAGVAQPEQQPTEQQPKQEPSPEQQPAAQSPVTSEAPAEGETSPAFAEL